MKSYNSDISNSSVETEMRKQIKRLDRRVDRLVFWTVLYTVAVASVTMILMIK